jgi:hypothetical protein
MAEIPDGIKRSDPMKTLLKLFILSLCFLAHAGMAANPNNQGTSMRATNGIAYGTADIRSMVGKISTGNVTNGSGSRVAYISDVTASTNGLQLGDDIFVTNAYITNLFSVSNAFITNLYSTTQITSNLFTTNLFTTNLFSSNAFFTNVTANTFVTSNLFTTNLFSTNITAQSFFTSNAFVTNLYVTNVTVLGNTTNLNLNPDQYMATDANRAQISTLNGGMWTNLICTNIVLVTKAPFSTNYSVRLVDQVLACTGTNQILTLPNGTNGVGIGTIFCFLMSSTTGFGSAIVTNANGVQTILTAAALSQTITNGQSLTLLWDGANWR